VPLSCERHFIFGEISVRGHVTPKQREAVTPLVEGGRACPVPDLTAPHGPFGMRRPRRSFRATGVITADLIDRTFVAPITEFPQRPQPISGRD
jgi:hypothetical protein